MMKRISTLIAVTGVMLATALPTVASADRWHRYDRHEHREEWKDLGLVSGAVGLFGLATHNPTVAAVGLGGALYSGVRYGDEFPHGGYRYDDRRHFYDHRNDDRYRGDRYREDRRLDHRR